MRVAHTSNSLLLSVLLLASQCSIVALASEQCEPCSGGEIDPTLSFDGVACTRWIALAGNSAADSPECAFDRMIGVWFCGCPVPPEVEETCTLCNNGVNTYTGDKPFPDSSVTCDQIATIPALDGERTCDELSFMGQFCGCEETATKCEICPNGLKPAHPENIFWQTGETCEFVQEVMSLSPLESCSMYLPDMMVDVPSYCGCPGSQAPFSCSLCPEGQHVADNTKAVTYASGSTCGDFESYVNYVNDGMFCEFLQEVTDCCEDYTISREQYQCTFCPGGGNVEHGDRILTGSSTSCEELASREGTDDCNAVFQSTLDAVVDTRIFCGCPDENPTGACDFCPPGEVLLYPNKTVDIDDSVATCSVYGALADSTSDDSFCSALQNVAGAFECCGPPPPMELEQQNFTVEEIETCSLCPLGLESDDPEKPFIGTTFTCGDYELELETFPAGDECDAIQQEFASTFDPTVYCQCPGVESAGFCRFCPEGQVLTDPTAWISDVFTTCSQMSDVARSTTDEFFCDSLQRVGEFYCCGDPEFARRLDRSSEQQPTTVSLKPELRPLYFSAVKALDTVQSSIANIVEKPSNTKIDPYEI